MSFRSPRIALVWCMLAGIVAFSACSRSMAADGPATVPACANPALPVSILGGDATPPAAARESGLAPLEVTDVIARSLTLSLAVANDESSRELGLMCVLRLQPQHGMIFVFGGDSKQEFWMKNTLISLDMIWVRADGTVDTVAADVPASTRATPDSKVARRVGTGKYVIELAAGEAERDGIGKGAHLKIAALL